MSYLLGGLAAVMFAATASAAPISYSVVGGPDSYLAGVNSPNSGSGTQEAWIETYLGTPIDYTQLASSGASAWMEVTGEPSGNLYAFDFGAGNQPTYFLVKTGNIKNTSFDTFLYQNLSNLQYAVINLSNFGPGLNIEIGKISHAGSATTTTRVPDGGMTVLLLGAAFSLLGLARRFLLA